MGKKVEFLRGAADEFVDVGVESSPGYEKLGNLLNSIPGAQEGFLIALLGQIAGYTGIGRAVGLTYVGLKSLDEGEKRFTEWINKKTGMNFGIPTYEEASAAVRKTFPGLIKEKDLNHSPGYLETVGNEKEAIQNIQSETFEESIKSMAKLEDESAKLEENISGLGASFGKKLNPKVKDLAENVEQFDEVASKELQAGRKYMFGRFGLDENGMPLGGLPKREEPPKREDLLVGGQVLSVTESEKDDIEGIQDGIKEQVSVLNHVADGLDMVGYDLKGVGSFATAIEQLTLASKLGGTAGFDSTKAYVAGISSLFQGIGANIGGGVGSALSNMGSMAASGASIGSAIAPGGTGAVVGAVVGGAVGLISSIFGGDDEDEQEEAARERMRQQI